LFLLRDQASLLLGDDPTVLARLVVLGEAEIKRAGDRENDDGEDDDLCARINLANQFAGELAQEDLGIVTAGRSRSFHGRLLDERRYVRAAATSRDHRGGCRNREEMNRGTRRADPDFIAVVDALVRFD
jgi:hypothetical protein